MLNTEDIKNEFVKKYREKSFRKIGNERQQSLTIEIQNAQFIVDKPWIIRKPNIEYALREINWYESMSLNVNDIPNGAPHMWKMCATPEGYVNSNYGWMVFSDENYSQFENCLKHLIEDIHTREACMIYNRPSMQYEYNKNGMHDFCCTYAVQCFINEDEEDNYHLGYTVYMRSNDAVFGFNNDALWHSHVQKKMAKRLADNIGSNIICDDIVWNAGSLHIYERHFEYLDDQ